MNEDEIQDNIEYYKTSALNSLKLIREIKRYPILYNNQAEGYNNHVAKEKCWIKIYEAMFPKYKSLPTTTQDVIKHTVRRRWKTLRSVISRDVKSRMTNKNYLGNHNPLIPEMQFLLPFIRSVYAKAARRQASIQQTQYRFSEENTMFNEFANTTIMEDELIDLTEDEKPNFVQNIETDSTPNNYVNQEPVSSANDQRGDPSAYCVTECRENEFVLNHEYGDASVNAITQTYNSQQPILHCSPIPTEQSNSKKRKQNQDDDLQFSEELLELAPNTTHQNQDHKIDREPEDEDRMFMLSLVSDLKGLPIAKKMFVKAEIVTSIARAAQ